MDTYIKNLAVALMGKKTTEHFTDAASGPSTYGMILLGLLITFVPLICFSYGAASLSYCLNKSIGWAVLCFLFPGFYYPYYALSLSPLCATKVNTVTQLGGRRH